MTKHTLKQAYFDDRARAAEIQGKILEIIPTNEYYHVIIMALNGILDRMIQSWIQSENEQRWYGE